MNKMPDGWVSVDWKDSAGHRWVSNIPESFLTELKSKILEHDGRIIKVVR